jgi:GT2 family glycosyltransferase
MAERDFVASITECLTRHPDWAGAEARLIPTGGEDGPLWDAPDSEGGGRFHTAAIAYRLDALVAAGGLDETFLLPACEDVELAARILPGGQIGFAPEARVYHPRRRVLLRTLWNWRRHWKYVTVLAKRYGFLAFPNESAGPVPRLRVAFAAVVSLPAGRFRRGLAHLRRDRAAGVLACAYAAFDILCGLSALREILFAGIPERRRYL